MLVPDQQQYVKSFKIPSFLLKSGAIIFAVLVLLTSVFIYDYWIVLQQVYENKHLSMENKQLREQIQLFQMKLNTINKDLEHIYTFEKKLRIISGLEVDQLSTPYFRPVSPEVIQQEQVQSNHYESQIRQQYDQEMPLRNYQQEPAYLDLVSDYEKMVLKNFGISDEYHTIKKLSPLSQRSLELAHELARFDFHYEHLQTMTHQLESKINELDEFLLDRESILLSTPVILPINGWITSYYGPRVNPVSKRLKMHEGIDIGAPYGTPIYSAADGKVVFSGVKPGFGTHVQIDHGYGMETIYAHSSKVLVRKGDIVRRGDVIAKVGSTGHSTGPHLHYEVRVNGVAVDPYYFLLEK